MPIQNKHHFIKCNACNARNACNTCNACFGKAGHSVSMESFYLEWESILFTQPLRDTVQKQPNPPSTLLCNIIHFWKKKKTKKTEGKKKEKRKGRKNRTGLWISLSFIRKAIFYRDNLGDTRLINWPKYEYIFTSKPRSFFNIGDGFYLPLFSVKVTESPESLKHFSTVTKQTKKNRIRWIARTVIRRNIMAHERCIKEGALRI